MVYLGNFTFQTWKQVPLNLRTFQTQKSGPSPRLYFYVPTGLGKVAFFFPYGVRAGGKELPFYLPDGQRAQIEERDAGKLVVIPIPAGMDGKVWSFERLAQPYKDFQTLTVPQVFALSPDVLSVPDDARVAVKGR